MDSEGFRIHLISQGLTKNGVSARVNWCRRVELDFNVDLDIIVGLVETTQKLRQDIYSHNGYTERQRRNFPNGVKKYFEYKNNMTLPRLNV